MCKMVLEIPEGWGFIFLLKNEYGYGMDIFWNHTITFNLIYWILFICNHLIELKNVYQ